MSGPAALLPWLPACAAALLAWRARAELARRSELVARACHELRGPLTAAHMALHSCHGDRARLSAVEHELRRAGRALEDLAVAPRGARAADLATSVDLAELLRAQAEVWGAVARSRGCRLVLAPLPRSLPVRGDRVRLAQALANLLQNALEHGHGTVELRARAHGDSVRVEVADEGPGLPASVAELARRPRAGRGERGRGLAIAAEIAARHGGRLAAAPSPAGARLALELPRTVA